MDLGDSALRGLGEFTGVHAAGESSAVLVRALGRYGPTLGVHVTGRDGKSRRRLQSPASLGEIESY